MHLYALTLQKPTAVNKAIYGNFSGSKAQEIVVSRGKFLELLRPDEATGKLQVIISQEVFGLIRTLIGFRLTGTNRDYIVVGSDSGRVVILQYDGEKNEFRKIHQETFGKTGVRRIVPGQYLAADPKGRAFMIASVEKQKFVYILNRDTQNNLTISSPLEAHKSHTLLFDICGVDVGYENPMFACIEVDYGDHEEEDSAVNTGVVEKMLTFYEMDLGLNHVVRKSTEVVPISAHTLISVPGSPEGPGGVLLCCEDFVIYRNGNQTLRAYYPKRKFEEKKPVMINAHYAIKLKDLIFFLLQSELGDLYKVSLRATKDTVHTIVVQYFDTIPPAISLCVLKLGYLFAASEFGNHGLYNFQSLGDDEEDPVISDSTMGEDQIVSFVPRALRNLVVLDELDNLSCITDMKVDDLTGEGHPQIYTLCGSNARSSLRVLRHGLGVNELAVSPIPGQSKGIWTVKGSMHDQYDKYIILSFTSATLVLSIGERVVEVTDSGLDSTKSTIHVGLLEDDSIIQVFHSGIRHIRKDKRINQWNTDGKIVRATCNTRQVVIALQGGEIIYFEIDSIGQLAEMEKLTLESDVVCMDIGSIPEGRQRCKFLAVGLADHSVKVFSLEPESCLSRLSAQALPSLPESVALLEMSTKFAMEVEEAVKDLYLHVGLNNGVLLKTAVDPITGTLTDTRTRFLGTKGVKLFKVQVLQQPALLALSSRPWISYHYLGRDYMTPLTYEGLDFASSFCSGICNEGLVGVNSNPQGHTLRILTIEKLGEIFNQTIVPLRYSPRKLLINPANRTLITIESDHRVYGETAKNAFKAELAKENPEIAELNEQQVGVPKLHAGAWGSCVRIIEPVKLETLEVVEFDNQCALSVLVSTFDEVEGDILLVGTARNYVPKPKSFSECYIHAYAFVDGGRRLEYLHSTQVEDLPYSLCAYKGKLIAGVGTTLRMFTYGKKKLLKKCEMKHFHAGINTLTVLGDRIFLTDLADSFHVLKHKAKENQFYEFADDVLPRWISSACVLDYSTFAGADKFENFFVCRLPQNVDEDIEEDPMTYKFKWETGHLNGAAFKMDQICNYFYGEMITTMQKTSLTHITSNEVILFGTSMGTIGAFLPFETKEDIDFFVHLEMYLRIEALPLCGRDHMAYRSFFGPVKSVIDGDLCEQFAKLEYDKQKVLSEELDRTPAEVLKKLEDIRNKIL